MRYLQICCNLQLISNYFLQLLCKCELTQMFCYRISATFFFCTQIVPFEELYNSTFTIGVFVHRWSVIQQIGFVATGTHFYFHGQTHHNNQNNWSSEFAVCYLVSVHPTSTYKNSYYSVTNVSYLLKMEIMSRVN